MGQPLRIPAWMRFVIATAFGLSSSAQAYFMQRLWGDPMTAAFVSRLVVVNLVYWYVPAAAAPTIMRLAQRFPIGRTRWSTQAAVHLLGVITYSVIHTAVMTTVRVGLWVAAGRPALSVPWVQGTLREYFTQLDWLVMTYLFLVGLAHALAYQRESESRAIEAAQLEARLAQAKLQTLQHQIRPHFLFNTLNTIAGLVHANPDAADAMIAGLGDLLRVSLHGSSVQEVPLEQELEVLQKYLDIEQTRFGDRLRVLFRVDPATRQALVPNLILQPLAENAVRHGIAPNARAGWIEVRTELDGDQLVMQVRDSGNGLPPDRLTAFNGGVGLGNTRARLEHLYPSAHQCLFSNLSDGFSVTIRLPFRSVESAAQDQGAA
jgi:two-component system LytT family sensor kinase